MFVFPKYKIIYNLFLSWPVANIFIIAYFPLQEDGEGKKKKKLLSLSKAGLLSRKKRSERSHEVHRSFGMSIID